MDLSHPSTLLVPAGVAALVAWRLYSRVKRLVRRQKLSKVRPWITVCVFPLLIALVLIGSISHPLVAFALVGGVVVGAALGIYGLRLTRFEETTEGLFYTPSVHLGIALSLVFTARIGYRVVLLYLVPDTLREGAAEFGRSPLTMLIFGTLAGYYVAYAVGLLRWRRRVSVASGAR